MSFSLANEKFIKIIKILLSRDFATVDYLSDQIDVSHRTVSNYINQLNNDLEDIAIIKNKRGQGYYLTLLDREKFEQVFDASKEAEAQPDSLQKRIAFIINRLMNESDTHTLDELAFELNISRSTLVNDLKKAAVVLDSYHLKIIGKPNKGMHISGNELSLRLFILENAYNFLYKESPIDWDVEEAIIQIARKYDFEATTTKRLIHSVVIMLDRFLNGYVITDLDEKYERLMDTNDYTIALEIKKAIERALPIQIPENEVLFITIPIAGRRTSTRTSSLETITVPSEIKHLLSLIADRITFEMNITLNRDQFSMDLEYHTLFMINRLLFGIHITNPLINDVKEKYPLAYKMAEIAGDVILEEMNLRPSADELGYLAFYFGIYLSEQDLKAVNFDQVAIVCGTGRGTAKIIEIQLRKVIGMQPSIDLYSEVDATKERLSNYDLILTTIPLSFPIDIPVIRATEIFDENEIANQINKVIYLKNYRTPRLGSRHSVISALLEEDRFFLLQRSQSYMENMLEMANFLKDQGFVDPGFPERIRKREEKSTMVFDRNIAMPHTINYASDQIILSVGVLPDGKRQNAENIQLIFLLALPETTDYDAGLLVKVYDEIIKIAEDEKLVQTLSECKTVEELFIHLDAK